MVKRARIMHRVHRSCKIKFRSKKTPATVRSTIFNSGREGVAQVLLAGSGWRLEVRWEYYTRCGFMAFLPLRYLHLANSPGI